MAGIAERVLDVHDLFRGEDIPGDATALRHAHLHGIDRIKGGADDEVLLRPVRQQDGADLAVHDLARALQDVIDELDRVVRAAQTPCHLDQHALTGGDGLRAIHGA